MGKAYRAKRRKEIEGREKPIWEDVGLTIIVYEKEGQTKYMIYDARSDDTYFCFRVEKKGEGESGSGGGFAADDSGDVPF